MLKSFYRKLTARFPALDRFLRRVLRGERLPGVKQSIRGRGNRIEAQGVTFTGVEVDIIGDDNCITVGPGSYLSGVTIRMRGSGHRIVFGENCRVSRGGVLWFEDSGGLLEVGAGTTMVEVHLVVDEPGSKIVIGRECMFANDIDIRTSDSHAILDAKTGERINPARDVIIGDHVWIASHVIVLKGVEIGSDSVVAAGAIVTRSCEPGVILAGNPAAVIKQGITWRRDRDAKS